MESPSLRPGQADMGTVVADRGRWLMPADTALANLLVTTVDLESVPAAAGELKSVLAAAGELKSVLAAAVELAGNLDLMVLE